MHFPGRATAALTVLLLASAARAQDFALTKDSEIGFQRLIHSAETGQLGDDVRDANVSVLKDRVRVELVLADGRMKSLLLTHKNSPQTFSRYFDIGLGDGATASDARRIGKVLDEAFRSDPFVVSLDDVGATVSGQPTMPLAEAWRYGGWKTVVTVLERRLVAPRGLGASTAVIIATTIGVLSSLVLLWGSEP